MKLSSVVAAMSLILAAAQVHASVVVLKGGPTVLTADRQASFDGLTQFASADLLTYVENGIAVQTPTSYPSFPWCALNPCWYANGGYSNLGTREANLARIYLEDRSTMRAVDFITNPIWLSGYGFLEATLVWETYRGGALVANGSFTFSDYGSMVGWQDESGFDELRVGSFDLLGRPLFGHDLANLITIDNLRVQFARVSEPAMGAIWPLCLGALAWFSGRKSRRARRVST